jgi:hypothetical protein
VRDSAPRPDRHAETQTYQLHVLLQDVEPAIWRRLHVPDETTLAILHVLIQIAFGWQGVRPHVFILRGKVYGGRSLADVLSDDIPLTQFGFRSRERFAYCYGAWDVQIRWETALKASSATPICVAGARAGVSERSRSPNEHAARIAHREDEMPWDEQRFMIEAVEKCLHAQPGQTVSEIIGDMDAFAEAVACVRAYYHDDPDRFERRVLNRQFQAFANGDRSWGEYDADDDPGGHRWG